MDQATRRLVKLGSSDLQIYASTTTIATTITTTTTTAAAAATTTTTTTSAPARTPALPRPLSERLSSAMLGRLSVYVVV